MAWSPVKSIYIIIVMVIKRIRGLENQNKLRPEDYLQPEVN
jgi:hypothetical protein